MPSKEISRQEFDAIIYEFSLDLKSDINNAQAQLQQLANLIEKANVYEDLGFNVKFYFDPETGKIYYEKVETRPLGFSHD